ncbi:Isocitrate/isopropylmalate dehydrogenase-domain-containing protein [Aspergillus floccosus]
MTKTTYNILVLPGDGIGPEIMREATKVLQTFTTPTRAFALREELIGGCSIDATGQSCTDAVKQAALASDAVLFAAVGGPKWDGMRRGLDGPEGGLLQLRKAMDIYANLRPCAADVPSRAISREYSPFRQDVIEGVDFVVVRENCGGAYFGKKLEEAEYAMDEWGYSTPEIQRITRLAAEIALRHNPPWPVISLDKANVLASSRLWRRVVEDTMTREYPQVRLVHQLADSASLILATNPRALNGVILADNTFGDMISDQAGSIVGTLGVLPSASLDGLPKPGEKANGLYEPTHGSAPTIAGQNIANPVAMILCVALMFRYSLNMEAEAQQIEAAVRTVLDAGVRTPDVGGKASTVEVGDAIYYMMSASLEDLRNLSSEEKTARIQSIANEITATFIALSNQKADGVLGAEHVAPIHDIIHTITQTNGQQREELERKIRRYQRYATQSQKEKLWMRRQFLVLMHRSEMVQRQWRERVSRLQTEMEEMRRELSSRKTLDPERRCQKTVEDTGRG